MIKIFLLLAPFLLGVQQSEDKIIEDLQNKFESIQTLKADFRQLSTSSLDDDKINVEGKFFYKKQDKYRIELTDQMIVSDGEKVWNYNKKLNRVVVNTTSNDPSSLSLDKFIFEYPEKSSIEILQNNEEVKIVKIIPEDYELNFSYAKLWIDENNLIKRIEVADAGGSKFVFEFLDIILNTTIKDSMFNLNIPEGTKVIDLR